jgi:hypothetical protein
LRSQIVASSFAWRPTPPALRVHRAGRRHALQRPSERPRTRSEYRDHAHLRTTSPLDGHALDLLSSRSCFFGFLISFSSVRNRHSWQRIPRESAGICRCEKKSAPHFQRSAFVLRRGCANQLQYSPARPGRLSAPYTQSRLRQPRPSSYPRTRSTCCRSTGNDSPRIVGRRTLSDAGQD